MTAVLLGNIAWHVNKSRSVQCGRTEGSEVLMWNWEGNQVRQILGRCSDTVEIRRTRIVAALRDGKGITLVKLLRAKYCADSCDTRWTKPLPAACPSQRWWAFSLSLPSSASRLATSSSTHWTSTKQVEDECGGKNDKATGSRWANDWRKMFGEVMWKCSQEKGKWERHGGETHRWVNVLQDRWVNWRTFKYKTRLKNIVKYNSSSISLDVLILTKNTYSLRQKIPDKILAGVGVGGLRYMWKGKEDFANTGSDTEACMDCIILQVLREEI